jgi:hypothetical protein
MATRFLYNNWIDYTTTVVTSSSEGADLLDTNVQNAHKGKVWRTGSSTASEWIEFDLGSAKAVQALVILAHTLTSGDTSIKVQGNASSSWGSPSVDVTLTYNAGTIYYYWAAAQSYRYWRVIFTKTASGETRDIGRIFLGGYYQCAKDIQYGSLEEKPVDMSDTSRSLGGATYSDAREIFHEVGIQFDLITDAQMTSFKTIVAWVGTHTPFFLHVDPTNKTYDWLYYVKFDKFEAAKVKIQSGGTSPLWTVKMSFSEEL